MIDRAEMEVLTTLLAKLVKPKKFGFHPLKQKRRYDYIYVKAQEKPENSKGVWYRTEEKDGVKVENYLDPIAEARLEGNLIEVTLVYVETEYGQQIKIDLILDTGDEIPTIVRSGASTFSEGVLRALMCAEAIVNPVNIIPTRANKSSKAVFGNIEIGGEKGMLVKEMPRLITWNPKVKPTFPQILATFLPAVNQIRAKLGHELLTKPIDRKAEYENQNLSTPAPPATDPTISIVTDEDIKLAIQKLGWTGSKVTEILAKEFTCERISLLSLPNRHKFTEILQRELIAANGQ
jgi:hypothetical protein